MEVPLHGQAAPVVQFLVQHGARALRQQAERVAAQVDRLAAVPTRRRRDLELRAEAAERVGGVQRARAGFVQRPGGRHAPTRAGSSARNSAAVPASNRRRVAASRSVIDAMSAPGTASPSGRVVAAQRHALGAHHPDELAQRVRVVRERVHVEAPQVVGGRAGIVLRAEVGPHGMAMHHAPPRGGQRAAAMRKCDAQPRQPLQHAAHHHRAERPHRFGRHAHEPGEPVLGHVVAAIISQGCTNTAAPSAAAASNTGRAPARPGSTR